MKNCFLCSGCSAVINLQHRITLELLLNYDEIMPIIVGKYDMV